LLVRARIPVNENGIVEWSLDDRCGVINSALERGYVLPFINVRDEKQTVNNSISELFG
jgi:hypothetical protein